MAKVLVDQDFLEDGLELICNKIRLKTGGTGVLSFPVEIASAVESIETGSGGITPTGTKQITENGTVDVTNFASAEVNVPQGITPAGTKQITENGTVDVTNYASAEVDVENGIPTLMDGGRELADGGITVQAVDGYHIQINDPDFDGSDVVACYITTSFARNYQFKVLGLFIIPTLRTSLGEYRGFPIFKEAGDGVHVGPKYTSRNGLVFTVGAHSLSVEIPSNSSAEFITGIDYVIYPIRGNRRS